MERKKVVSGPIHGPVTEKNVWRGKGRGIKRAEADGRVPPMPTSDGGFKPLPGEADK